MKTQKILVGLCLLSFCWLPVLSAQFTAFCKYWEGEKTYLLRGKVMGMAPWMWSYIFATTTLAGQV